MGAFPAIKRSGRNAFYVMPTMVCHEFFLLFYFRPPRIGNAWRQVGKFGGFLKLVPPH